MANKKQKKIVNLPLEIRADIKDGLLEEGKVKVVGLGIFENKKIPARSGRNPATGDIVEIPSYIKIKFKPTKSLKEAVQ